MNTKKLFDFVEEKIEKSNEEKKLFVTPIVWWSDSWKDMVANIIQKELSSKSLSSSSKSISSVLKLCADNINQDFSWENWRQVLREIYEEISYKFWENTIPKILCSETVEDVLIIPWCRWVWQMKRLENNYKSWIISPTIFIDASEEVRLLIMRKWWKYNTIWMSDERLIAQLKENDEKENGIWKLNNVPWCKNYCYNIVTQYKLSIEP